MGIGMANLNNFAVTALVLMLFSTNTAFAVQCEVKFRAKKVSTEKHWFGNVDNIKTRSGTTSGEGSSKSECESQALEKITKEGWEITYQEVISSK